MYTLTVEAVEVEDGQELDGSGTATVNITVTDANDHAPEFIDTPYEFTVAENVTLETVVGTVSANDTDNPDSEVGMALQDAIIIILKIILVCMLLPDFIFNRQRSF